MGTLQAWLRKSAGLPPSAMMVFVASRHTRLRFALLLFAGVIAAISHRPAWLASPSPPLQLVPRQGSAFLPPHHRDFLEPAVRN